MKIKIMIFFSIFCFKTNFAQKWTYFNSCNTSTTLASNVIWSISIGPDNSIWFGTDQGLSKFDGEKWINYTAKEWLSKDTIVSALNNRVKSTKFDTKYNLWALTDIGLAKFDGKSWKYYQEIKGNCMTLDSHDNIWIIDNYKMIKFDSTDKTIYEINHELTDIFSDIKVDKDENIWIVKDARGLLKYDGLNWSDFKMKAKCLETDKNGNIWCGTFGDGLAKFDGSMWKFLTDSVFEHKFIISVAFDADGSVWCGHYNGGMSKFDGEKWENTNKSNGLVSNWVSAIVIDAQNNKWAGTDNGVSKFDGLNFESYKSNGIVGESITSIASDNLGNIWIGSWNGISKFNRIKGINIANYFVSDDPMKRRVDAISVDWKNNVWVGLQQHGVIKLLNNQWIPFDTLNLGHSSVNLILTDSIGNKWIATNGGVWEYNKDDSLTNVWEFKDNTGILPVFAMSIDKDGSKWFGFGMFGNGVWKYDGKNWIHFTIDDGLSSDCIYSISADAQNNIWFATSYGLSKFDSKKEWTIFYATDGLAGNYVQKVAVDSKNNIWVKTDGAAGINKLDGKNLTFYRADYTGICEDFTIDNLNNIWIGTLQELLKFDDHRINISSILLNMTSYNGSKATTNIISNVKWNIITEQSWLTISPSSGSNNATVTVTASANNTDSIRMGILLVFSNKETPDTIIVNQDASITYVSNITLSNIIIYPIPVNKRFFISSSGQSYIKNLALYSLDGVQIYNSTINRNITEVNMCKYPSGLYLMKVATSDNKIVINKIIKQ
jgi:ligand-binding sensor domain-containing protein